MLLACMSIVSFVTVGIPCVLFPVIAIAGTAFWVWMIIDCATHEPNEGNNKIVWIVIILLTHVIGALIYFLVRRPQRIQEIGH